MVINGKTIAKRSPIVVLLLSLVTCGIYVFWWMYKVSEELKALAPNSKMPSGMVVILLSICTCGLYTIYWYYLVADTMNFIYMQNHYPSPVSPSKYLIYILVGIILSCCGVGFIVWPLVMMFVQSDLNNLISMYIGYNQNSVEDQISAY